MKKCAAFFWPRNLARSGTFVKGGIRMHWNLGRLRLVLLLAATIAALGINALADNVPAVGGTGSSGNDWTQEFCTVNCLGTANSLSLTEIQVYIPTSGVTLSSMSTAYSNIGETTDQSGWSTGTIYDNGQAAFITGPGALNELYFTLGFSSAQSTPLSVDVQLWSGTTFDATDSGTCNYNGSAWGCSALSSPVIPEAPEPVSAVLLGAVLLAGIGVASRKAPTTT